MAHPTFHNLIGGQWLPAASGKTVLNLNPANHADVVGAFPSSHAEDVALAVEAAKRAFASWRLVPAPKRAEILVRAGLLLKERKEQFAHDMTREMGKVLTETRGDVQEAIDEAFYVGRRRAEAVWPDHPKRVAEQVRHVHEDAGRRCGFDYAVELPHGDSELEAVPGTGLRQYLRHQAGYGYAFIDL